MEQEQASTFLSHLIELRSRLLRALIAFVVVFLALFPFANRIYHWLALPMLAKLPVGGQMIATGVTTPFFIPLKVTMLLAFLLTLPYWLYQAWAFVAPGLYTHERKLVLPLLISSIFLFLCGLGFAYFLVLPIIFGFMVKTAPVGVAVMTDIGNYLDFIVTLFLAFGIAFQVPIAVVVLVYLGVINVEKLREIRGYVVVGAFVIGAIFTPPDIVSQFLLAGPLCLLYELGILVAGFIKPKQA